MYTEFFGLNEKPFSISPDPRYLYLSQRHADALAHLLYGISESGGFIQLTGEVGTGKTTLIRSVLGQLPAHTEIALILNPQLSTKQFLQAICQELHVPFQGRDTARALIDHLNLRLLELHATGKRAVLIVDEAQTMSPDLLEQVRLLTNLETSKQKLLQIILIGQPELREMLARPGMRQVAQRITGRYHLEPLSAADTAIYVSHRMRVAGGRPGIFRNSALRALFRLSQGIPRLINVIADRALLAAYTLESADIGARLVHRAADEVFGRRRKVRWWPWAATATGLGVLAVAVAALLTPRNDADFVLAMLDVDSQPAPSAASAVTAATTPSGGPAGRTTPVAGPFAPTAGRPAATGLLGLVTDSDAERATASLFHLWGLRYEPELGPACEQAAGAGLRCLAFEHAALDDILALGVPALIELAMPALLDFGDGAGRRRGTVLLPAQAADTGRVTVLESGRKLEFASEDLMRVAAGPALLLFRPAVVEPATLAEGSRGPAVVWLRTVLRELRGNPLASDEPDRFDGELASALRGYQQSVGLEADAVLTDHTLLRLQADIGTAGPLSGTEPR